MEVGVYDYIDEDIGVVDIGKELAEILSCEGCQRVTYRSQLWHGYAEDLDVPVETLYPARQEGRRLLEHGHFIPEPVRSIYFETHKALTGEQPVLAAVGMRILVEAVCKQRGAPGRVLRDKIDGLVQVGALGTDGASVLHDLRSMGNLAAHEVKAEDPLNLSNAMGVVEHLLQGVFIIPAQGRARALREKAAEDESSADG